MVEITCLCCFCFEHKNFRMVFWLLETHLPTQVMASRYSSHILILIYHFNFRLLKFPLPPGHVFHYGQDANTRHLVSIESAIASYSSLVVSEKMPDSSSTGWWFQPLRKILVSWDHYPQYIEK